MCTQQLITIHMVHRLLTHNQNIIDTVLPYKLLLFKKLALGVRTGAFCQNALSRLVFYSEIKN